MRVLLVIFIVITTIAAVISKTNAIPRPHGSDGTSVDRGDDQAMNLGAGTNMTALGAINACFDLTMLALDCKCMESNGMQC